MTQAHVEAGPLSGKSVRELRARAHALKPVVWIAANGATATVLREIDRSLRSHELIKIHAAVEGRSDRAAVMDEICNALGASPVQIIGKMLVVFRANPSQPEPTAPAARKASPTKRQVRNGSAATATSLRSAPRKGRRPPAKTRAGIAQR